MQFDRVIRDIKHAKCGSFIFMLVGYSSAGQETFSRKNIELPLSSSSCANINTQITFGNFKCEHR